MRPGTSPTESLDERAVRGVEQAVHKRYSAASQAREPALCCPVRYDGRLLDVLPQEIVERDYGCGDPSQSIREGDTVLDLGCGGGKICYIAAQIVGPKGAVFGVDMNDDMLALARRHQQDVGERVGYHNTHFKKGRIQDLALDLEAFEAYLEAQPVRSAADWLRAQAHAERLRQAAPLIADASIDVLVSNCVLNLVPPAERKQLFAEMFRVLRRGGRAVISDIVSDEPIPDAMRRDPELWSGCLSGAFEEEPFLEAFEEAGFHGMRIRERQRDAWATIEGIEFRSMTVEAYKGQEGPCLEHRQAVVYKGPFKSVTDDDGHVLRRGVRTAVCRKTAEILAREPYGETFEVIEPRVPVAAEDAVPFDCRRTDRRDPREQKGEDDGAARPADANGCGSNCC